MMTIGDVKQLIECSCGMPHRTLLAAFLEVSEQLIETMTALEGYFSSSGELALQYQQMKEKADGYEEDNKRLNSLVNQLRQQIPGLQDQLHLSRKDQFGRKTEQASALPENTVDNKPEDLVEEEPGEVPETTHTRPVLPFPGKTSCGKRKKGQRKKDLGNLPVKNEDYSFKMGYTALSNLLHDLGMRENPVRLFEQSLIDNSSGSVAIDGHVIRSCSNGNDLAEPGYKMNLMKAPQVNLLIAYDIKNKVPLMYRTCRGSSVDKVSVVELL